MADLAGMPLLERSRELEAIGACLDSACAGDGTLTVVEGPAGIGKTSLLAAAAELAREREMTVLAARGGVLEQQLEYGVARQLVEKPVLRADPERRAELLGGPAAASAAALGLGELPLDPGLGGDPSPQIQHALHWLIATAAELEIAGAPTRRLSFDELTASERRIAGHAADGRTNREIAAELFITPKTVENHLTRVYGKLGIGSRRELAGLL